MRSRSTRRDSSPRRFSAGAACVAANGLARSRESCSCEGICATDAGARRSVSSARSFIVFPPLPLGEGKGEGLSESKGVRRAPHPLTLTLPPPMSAWEPKGRGDQSRGSLFRRRIQVLDDLHYRVVVAEEIL